MSVVFDEYSSSRHGSVFHPKHEHWVADKSQPFYLVEDMRVFDKSRFSTEVHAPIKVLSLKDKSVLLDGSFPRCLDMPLRLKGDDFFSLPSEWLFLFPIISEIVNLEASLNPSWRDYYTYMTVDSSIVSKSSQQRHGGLHVDGFQGSRINPKHKITRNYVVSSNGGTVFYPQRFDASLDDSTYDLFKGFDLQKKDGFTAEENTVYFMDSYTVHESGFALRDGFRTFLRVTFDLKEFDRKGNTHNSMLDYDWNMVERNVHETLYTPTESMLAKK